MFRAPNSPVGKPFGRNKRTPIQTRLEDHSKRYSQYKVDGPIPVMGVHALHTAGAAPYRSENLQLHPPGESQGASTPTVTPGVSSRHRRRPSLYNRALTIFSSKGTLSPVDTQMLPHSAQIPQHGPDQAIEQARSPRKSFFKPRRRPLSITETQEDGKFPELPHKFEAPQQLPKPPTRPSHLRTKSFGRLRKGKETTIPTNFMD